MTFDEYQRECGMTAVYPTLKGRAMAYLGLGVASEAGEIAGHIKKWVRDESGTDPGDSFNLERMRGEIGDVMWYLAMLATEMGWKLDHIATVNLAKLADRAQRGAIGGSGDER